jgi:hypothetical protein
LLFFPVLSIIYGKYLSQSLKIGNKGFFGNLIKISITSSLCAFHNNPPKKTQPNEANGIFSSLVSALGTKIEGELTANFIGGVKGLNVPLSIFNVGSKCHIPYFFHLTLPGNQTVFLEGDTQ